MQKCDLCIYFIQNVFILTIPFCIDDVEKDRRDAGRPDVPEEVKEDKKMRNVNYRPNEYERYADLIEEMLKALKK